MSDLDITALKAAVLKPFLDQTVRDGGCRMWTGRLTSTGYAAFGRRGRVHRIVWEIVHGPIPSGMVVCHSCDRPACIAVDHLWLGTLADNNRDCRSKGRDRRPIGSQSPNASLTEDLVARIRRMRRSGVPVRTLERLLGVDRSAISKAARGKSWKHVSEPPFEGRVVYRVAALEAAP